MSAATCVLRSFGGVGATLLLSLAACAAPKAEVLIARQDIATGTVIEDPEALFKTVAWTGEGPPPPSAIRDPKGLKGRVVIRKIDRDSILVIRDLGGTLPKGTKPVTLKMVWHEDIGHIDDNSHVDAILTTQVKGKTETTAVVDDLIVLAWDIEKKKGPIIDFLIVTIAAAPDQAAKIADAQKKGSLSVRVRQQPENK